MNITLFIIGCCNIVIGCGTLKKKGPKRNLIAYLNLILGLLLITLSVTLLNHSN